MLAIPTKQYQRATCTHIQCPSMNRIRCSEPARHEDRNFRQVARSGPRAQGPSHDTFPAEKFRQTERSSSALAASSAGFGYIVGKERSFLLFILCILFVFDIRDTDVVEHVYVYIAFGHVRY